MDILETIETKKEGRPSSNSQLIASIDEAAKKAGLGNKEAAHQTIQIANNKRTMLK